jgi:mRNA interferase RelE/StbE
MSAGPTYRIIFKPSAMKSLGKLPKKARAAMAATIDALATDPRPPGHVKMVDSPGLYRVRSGSYRAIYGIEDDRLVVYVFKIGDRKDVCTLGEGQPPPLVPAAPSWDLRP